MVQTRSQTAALKGQDLSGDRGSCFGVSKSSTGECTGQNIQDEPPLPRSTPILQRGRKRAIEDIHRTASEPLLKRLQKSSPSKGHGNPVDCWVTQGTWPRELFDADMNPTLARKRSSSSLRHKRAASTTSMTPSDQKPREEKSIQYRDPRYRLLLETKFGFMRDSDLGITNASKASCNALLEAEQATPENSLFRDDIFKQTCSRVEDRNEARVFRDITPLIVPSAELLALYGFAPCKCLIDSTNEGWNNSIPLTEPRPQPDYSVGFRREAFTEDQLVKLSPFIGNFIAGDQSVFMATYLLYFPFLACEVKCGTGALDVADRQNAHSMTLAVRGVVELFRLVKRENELLGQILAFSISHDHRTVRIYGHYPAIDEGIIKYYRHQIDTIDITARNGKEKWTAYRFTKNVYDIWMPVHFKRICSAVDQLPEIAVDGSQSDPTWLSQCLEELTPSEVNFVSQPVGSADKPHQARQVVTPETSSIRPGPTKRKKSPVEA